MATFTAGDDGSVYAIVASQSDHGVQLIDVSDPSAPVAVGSASDGSNGFTELNAASSVATFTAVCVCVCVCVQFSIKLALKTKGP